MGILEEVKAGKPISVPIIDAHTHLRGNGSGGAHHGFYSYAQTVQMMDHVGVDVIVSAPNALASGNVELANRQVAEAHSQFPDRIYGMLSVSPHNGVEGVKREVARYCNAEGFVAVKMLIGYHGSPLRPEYAPAFAFANECRCPVTLHCWEHDLSYEEVAKLLEQYPNLKLILAHLGGGVRNMTVQMSSLVKQCDRLYFDTSGSFWNRLGISEVAEFTGDDRLCYGSDLFPHDFRPEIGRIVFSGMPEESMKKIFSENYLRLLNTSQYGKIKLAR